MPDLFWLANLGRASVDALWLPVLAWTAIALVAEAALRLTRPRAALALPVRGAVLAALPLAVAVPLVVAAVAPGAAVLPFLPEVVADPLLWLPEVAVGGPAPAVEAAGPPLVDVLLGLAVLGVGLVAIVHLLRLGGALVGVVRTRRTLPAADAGASAAVEAARDRLGVTRAVSAAEAPVGVAPFTVGVRRPLVALPADLGGEARELAALHEVAHVRRADAGWHAAQRAVSALFAAHPLVWALGRGLDLDRERAADAAVLAHRPDQRKAYADLLFSYAALPAPPLALGAARGSSTLKTRIDAMTSPLSPARARRLSHLGRLAGLLAVVAVVGVAASTAPPPAPAAPTLAAPTLAAPTLAADDSLVQHIDRIDVVRQEGSGPSIVVTLKDSAPAGTAAAFEADLADPTGDVSLTVVGPEGSRSFVGRPGMLDSRGSGTAPVRREGPPAGPDSHADAIDRVDVTRDGGTALIEITLKDGVGRADAEAIADDARRPGVTIRVVMVDGTAIERRPARTGARADTTEVFEIVEQMPQLIGGLDGLMARVEYPDLQARTSVEGRAVVQFIVDEEGRVVDPAVIRSSGNDGLDEAAIAAVRGSRFEPGMQRGEPVKVRFAVPITFRLGDDGPAPLAPGPTPEVGDLGPDAPEIFEVAEQQPVLIGGLAGLQERIVYPPLAREAGIEGVVVVQFVVDEEGAVQDAAALRSPDDILTEAALAAVRGSSFEPGMQRGVPVKVRFAVPITFRLPAEEE